MKQSVLFVTGIDTGIGKSYATAFLLQQMRREGLRVVSQKPVQTGCLGSSEDLATHDFLAGCEPNSEDADNFRCSYLFPYPASPHLAAEIADTQIDPERIDADTKALLALGYDRVLMEGAGGLMVPLTRDLLTIDFISDRDYPVALVTGGRLGSINHTLLSIEALEHRDIRIEYILFNHFGDASEAIKQDTEHFLRRFAETHLPNSTFLSFPYCKN